ncbi:MAG TPA: nucleotide exchange factor GrpE [Pseudonocardia sp.]|nr:nucleotide exchange factor GrpE [Pseudonocardia sp.]
MSEEQRSAEQGRPDRSESGHAEPERVVVRDRRRIDPLTGEVRPPEGEQPAGAGPAGAGQPGPAAPGANQAPDPAEEKLAELSAQLDERTADLQRVSAEYANYRRRVDRDREAITVAAKAQVAGELLTVLDDVVRAEAHGDLTGAFKSVADKLVGALQKIGLTPFGAEGDEFDPSVHEAVQHSTSHDVAGPTVTTVLRPGYKLGDRLLRPAMVAVTDRDPDAGPAPARPSGAGAEHEGNNVN